MSPDGNGNGKTAWDRAAEEEWVYEQGAADEDRRAYQSPGVQSPGVQLQPEAAAALRTMSPKSAWLQVTDLVSIAIEEHRDEAEQLGQELGIGGYWTEPRDLNELYIRATALNPVFAINEFNYVNPEIRLDSPRLFERMAPLEALRAVIRMWTENNHRNEAL
jgi:hypothetical protein